MFEQDITTRALIVASKRGSTKKGQAYQRVVFVSLTRSTASLVQVSRVTKNCIYFSDGFRIKKDTGRVITKTLDAVSYIPA
jgi:hypothetical protein